ncbi:MAG: MFS transporter [Chthoniobacterales bacterium]|nr:MFS transporter [Chthoniobacterales bacterium]
MELTLEQLSDRLDRLPTSRYHARILIIAALSLLFDTLDHVITGFVLASLRTTWDFELKTVGLISAIGLCGYLLGSFFCGFVADRIGRKKTILFTLIFYSFFSSARGFSNTLSTLAILNFFTLIFIGAENSTVPPYLVELWPTRSRGKLVGWMMGFFGLGIALSPIWALLIIPTWGWRWALFLTAPFALIGGIIRSSLPESPRWLLKVGRVSEAEGVLARIEAEVEKLTGTPLPLVTIKQPSLDRLQPLLRPRDLLGASYRRITLMLWAAWFAEYGVLYSYQTFVPTLLSAEGYSIVKSFQYAVVIYGSGIPGYILGGQLVEWLDRKYAILLSFAVTGLFGTMFGLSKTPLEIMLFGGLTVFSLALGSTSIYTYTPELYPTEIRATGMGIASAWGRAGAVTLLLSFGYFFAVQGKSLLFIISDSVLLVASVAVFCFGPSTRGRKLEDTSQGVIIEEVPKL